MAASQGRLRVGRYFAGLAAIVAALYLLVFFTGPDGSVTEKLKPKLGLDLQGGTTVTLRAALPDGKAPGKDQLQQAREIIENRVNGSGVAEFEVLIEGDRNLVINVPGKDQEDVKRIGQPAELRFREVLNTADGSDPDEAKDDDKDTEADPSESPSPSTSPSASTSPSPSASGSPSTSASPSQQVAGQVKREDVLAKFSPEALQALSTAADPTSLADPAVAPLFDPVKKLTGAEIAALPVDFQFKVPQVTCEKLNQRPPGSISKPKEKVVACEQGADAKYELAEAKVVGTDVDDADFSYSTEEGWNVSIQFTRKGQDRWTDLTKATVNKQVAVVLDNQVVSAPNIESVIPGDATISGSSQNPFTKGEAKDLANKLKYGSLPLTFTTDTAYSISPTLGLQQLKAGMLAGGIGLVLVVIYSLIYYRALGLVTIASLACSATLIYASVVLLGRQIGFTLTLAGVAGFIVAVGITADSFVVYFERLKDEVMDGRSVRSAVPRAWARARRTILSADAVSFLAAAVLYILAVGAVKGFAFTLGLSTVVDVVVVFLFTYPLVALLSRSKTFASPRVSGLGGVRNAHASPLAPASRVAVKES